MKRFLILAVLVVILPVLACSQTVLYYDSGTHLTFSDDNIPDAGDIIEYEIYGFETTGGDIRLQVVNNLVLLATVDSLPTPLLIPNDGIWALAGRIKKTTAYGEILYSGFIYSINAPPESDPEAFVVAPKGTPLIDPVGFKIIIIGE